MPQPSRASRIRGASDQSEVRRLIQIAQDAEARGEKLAEWCWQEDDQKIANYDPNTVRGPNWILYSDLIAAQLEERWQADKAAIVEIDINGKVRSATGGKAYAAETGTQYTVDFNKMTQKNMKSSRGERSAVKRSVLAWLTRRRPARLGGCSARRPRARASNS